VTATFLETYTDNTALASLGKDYLYWIQAENIIGNGSMAGPVLGHPEPGPPSAPTNVRTIGEGNGYVRIKWDWILDYLDEGIFKNFTIYRVIFLHFQQMVLHISAIRPIIQLVSIKIIQL
jgi:hypothetical protein